LPAAARRLSISGGGGVIEHAAAATFSGVNREKCEWGAILVTLLKTSIKIKQNNVLYETKL